MLPWVLCGVLAVIIAILIIKIRMMQKSMNEICSCLAEHLSSDTNQLITVSSGDRYVRRLAGEIAKQLAELRRQRRQYINGDRELKEAVTNISHDLRTPLTAICGYLDLLEAEEMTGNTKRYVEQIANRAEALKALTEELFRYSVISSVNSVNIIRHLARGSILSYFKPYFSLENIIGFVFLGVISTILATGINNFCLARMQVSTMAAFSGVSTLVTIVIGVIFHNEKLYYFHYIGLSLILVRMIGVSVISILRDAHKKNEAPCST